MKHPKVLVQFVYVYHLGLDEVVLIKNMMHPSRLDTKDKDDPKIAKDPPSPTVCLTIHN